MDLSTPFSGKVMRMFLSKGWLCYLVVLTYGTLSNLTVINIKSVTLQFLSRRMFIC